MHIEKLSLFNFKNYEEVALSFSQKVNCLVGVNGSGKTNMLDAIHYLSLTKSAFNTVDSQNIRFGEKVFSVKGTFVRGEKNYEILCGFEEGVKKMFKIDKKEYNKLSEHVGNFPVVLIAPNDLDVIRDASEVRRKFFDSIICQLDSSYLENLLRYNHHLKQRNSALKKFAFSGRVDYDLIQAYDSQLLIIGDILFQSRSEFILDFKEMFQKHYAELSSEQEQVDILYKSEMADEKFNSRYKESLKKDLALERTTMGVHRDDYKFIIKNKPLKKFGSQGQQKTFLVALKMAHFEIIKNSKGYKPILLLDDIFDKLDTHRIRQLVEMIAADAFGQIFITDAREERTKTMLGELSIDASFYHVDKGTIKEVSL